MPPSEKARQQQQQQQQQQSQQQQEWAGPFGGAGGGRQLFSAENMSRLDGFMSQFESTFDKVDCACCITFLTKTNTTYIITLYIYIHRPILPRSQPN